MHKDTKYILNTPPSVHLSRQKSTKHGQEVNPFSMEKSCKRRCFH
jgi:hypothetical protein